MKVAYTIWCINIQVREHASPSSRGILFREETFNGNEEEGKEEKEALSA